MGSSPEDGAVANFAVEIASTADLMADAEASGRAEGVLAGKAAFLEQMGDALAWSAIKKALGTLPLGAS